MEHLTILGGEWLLPFARSRIAAMRKLGAEYATQKFEVDGTTVRVRIEPGHEYIWLSGGVARISMDSGIVGYTADSGPNRNLPGILYDSAYTATYNAAFAPYEGSTRWRKHAGATGQISGHLAYSSAKTPGRGPIAGKVPYDGMHAECLLGRVTKDTTTDPATWVIDKGCDAVYLKKQLMTQCPPSIFTGRCRLWIQAIYGSPLFQVSEGEQEGSDVPLDFPVSYRGPGAVGSSAPSLFITPYRHNPDDKDEDTTLLIINTSTGVHLDTSTGKHWMMYVAATNVTCFELIPRKDMKKLQKYLMAGDNTFGTTDKKHLETYMLATSLPSLPSRRTLNIDLPYPGNAMAYGWHWNWSGTVADIVTCHEEIESYGISGPFLKLRSSHYRLSMTFAGGPSSVSVATLQNEAQWKLTRAFYAVFVPDFILGGHTKVNPMNFSDAFDFEDVVIYAFYRGDAVTLCTVSCTINAQSELSSEGPLNIPPYDRTNYGGWVGHPCKTKGSDGGWVRDYALSTNYFLKCKFSVGGYTTPDLPTGDEREWQKWEVTNVNFERYPTYEEAQSSFSTYSQEMYGDTPTPHSLGVSWAIASVGSHETWNWISSYGTSTHYGDGIFLIPFNDSEAVVTKYIKFHYEEGFEQTDTLSSLGTASHWSRIYFQRTQYFPVYGGAPGVVTSWLGPSVEVTFQEGPKLWPGGSGQLDSTTGVYTVAPKTVVDSEEGWIHSKLGITPAVLPYSEMVGMLATSNDHTSMSHAVMTGTAPDSNLIIALNPAISLLRPTGIIGGPENISNPTIVGWV